MPPLNFIINKFKNVLNKYKKINEKYNITQFSAVISFYMMIASISLFGLVLGVFGQYINSLDSYILSKVLDIVQYLKYGEYFQIDFISVFIIINIIWSSSKVINGYNKVCDFIYLDIIKFKRRNGWILRISSFVMFSFLLVILILQLTMNLFLNNILKEFIKNIVLFRFIEFVIELLIIYFIIVLLYIYAPPYKTKYKDVKIGAAVSTMLLYLFIVLIILIYNLISYNIINISLNNSFTMILSIYSLSIFVCNFIIILGIIINKEIYDKNKKRNIY